MVTGPVQKSTINKAGIAFTGHTEFLAEYCKQELTVMMLATEGLRVALATTHLPLSAVPGAISTELLEKVIQILHKDLQIKFGIENPTILVCGLNPHAGEGGYLGHEEIEIIEPVLSKLQSNGMDLIGPLPADTLFTSKYLDHADAVLSMYHDQGLPVLKYKGFGFCLQYYPWVTHYPYIGRSRHSSRCSRLWPGKLQQLVQCNSHSNTNGFSLQKR